MSFSSAAARVLAAACLVATIPPAATRAAATPAPPAPIAPFKCPDTGPNAGQPPQAMARSAGRTLVLCADVEPAEGKGIAATAAAIHEPAAPTAAKPIFAAEEDTNRLRILPVPDGGFALTLEALLPLGGPDYGWTPIAGFDVACGPEGCGERGARCALSLAGPGKRDLMGKVRQALRTGRLDASVAQRLIDDLAVQALLGEDVAAWTIEHLDRLAGVPPQTKEAIAEARALLARARGAGCEALVVPPDRPYVATSPAEQAAQMKEKIARKRAEDARGGTAAPTPSVVDLETVGWLVGGRWEGRGTTAGGGVLHVEETYRWGPGRRSIRFEAKNAGGKPGAAGAAVEGVLFFEAQPGKVMLWNVKPGGGLSESVVTRADSLGIEMVGADGRVRLSLMRADMQTRTVESQQAGTWKTVATATYERHPR